MSPEQAAEKTIQERLNARCETLEQYLFDCFMDSKYANAASKANSVVFLLKKDIEALIEDTGKQVLSGVSWQKENGWISVEDRLPTQEDTFIYDEVLTIQIGRARPSWMKYWEIKDCPFTKMWLGVPPAPASTINK